MFSVFMVIPTPSPPRSAYLILPIILTHWAFLFVEAIPSSGSLYLLWDRAPIEIIEQINLLIVYTWPLSAVIKDDFLKIFVYQHEKFAYNKYK